MFVEFDSLLALEGGEVRCVEFWPSLLGPPVFAALGGRRIAVCEISPKQLKLLRTFRDEDEAEDFHCSCFTQSLIDNRPLVCAGGASGVVKIVNLESAALHSVLVGHGGPVNDLKPFTGKPDLLFSCSTDESIRLWSVSTRQCLRVFSGHEGHRDSVTSLSLHHSMKWMATSSGDRSIKVWDVDGTAPAYTATFEAPCECVEWVGDLLLSTSGTCRLWKPDMRRRRDARVTCITYEQLVVGKLGTSPDFAQFAVGGRPDGSLLVFALEEPQPQQRIQLTKPIRTAKFSPDNRWIVCGEEDGTVCCLQRIAGDYSDRAW